MCIRDRVKIPTSRNPLASLSYGRGSNLTIQDSAKPAMAIIRWRRYGVQTFKHHGAFSRYTPLNKRSLSMPELPQIGQPTIVEGMDVEDQRAFYEYACSRCFHDYQMQQMEQDGKRV